MYQLTEWLRLISFKISRNAKVNPLGQSLDDMLVYAKDSDSLADDRIAKISVTSPILRIGVASATQDQLKISKTK